MKQRLYRNLKIFSVLFLLLTLFSGCQKTNGASQEPIVYSSFRDVPGLSDDVIKAIENLQKQKIDSFIYGMTPSAEVYSMENGEINGYSTLFCDWLSQLFGIPFKPAFYAWGDLLAGLESGEVDFTGEMTATDERRKTYYMTDAIAERSLKYFRLSGSKSLTEIALERKPRYALLEGTTTVDEVTAVLGEDTFEIVLIDDSEPVYGMLKSGLIDAYINEGPEESIFDLYGDVSAEIFFPLIYSPVSLTTQKKELEPIIIVVQKILENQGMQYLTELYNRGYNEYLKNKLLLQLTETERRYIQDHPVIPFAAEYDNYPVSFYNVYEKEWQGMCIDVLRQIEAFTGMKFEIVNSPDTPWPVLLRMLENGEILMISELIRSDAREGNFLWPQHSIMSDRSALVSKSDFRNININEVLYAKVGLSQDTVHAELFRKWFPNHQNSIEYIDSDAAFKALEDGEVDMIMSSMYKLLKITNYQEQSGYKGNIVFDYYFESTYGINKNEGVLCSIVDKTLNLVDINKISVSWINKTFDYNSKLIRAQQPWLLGTSLLLLILIVLLFILFSKSRKSGKVLENQVQNRTAQLRKQQDFMYLVNDAAALLLESETENITDTMIHGMEMIGKRVEVDRINIFQNYSKNGGNKYFRQVFKWSHDDFGDVIFPPELSYQDSLPRWEGILQNNECINGPIKNLPESERLYLSSYKLISTLVIPIFLRGHFWGFATFDDCRRDRIFPEVEVSTLRFWCMLAVGTIQRIKIALNMEAVTNNYKGLIWSIDNEGTVTIFKGRYLQLLKQNADNIEGAKLESIQHNSIVLDINKNVGKTFLEGQHEWISEIEESVFHSYTAPVSDDNGKVVGVVGSTDDVTETVNLQRALENASTAKSAFLARMSHEIRTPMNAIIGMTELALRDNILPVTREHILTIKRAGTNLLSIINDILDFSKIETGQLDIIPTKYLLSSLINDVINIIKTRVLESRLRFIVNIDCGMPNTLFGDVSRIRQILLNLLSNAVKYTERGYVSLLINGKVSENGNVLLCISVTDSGRGIRQEDIKKLFADFSRLDTVRNASVEGTGLGLAIVQNLVKSMNGEVSVQSVYGEGSTFAVSLPQKIIKKDRIASIENVREKKVLIYERREILKNSIIDTMESLDVDYKLVSSESEFYNEVMTESYNFIFLASVLYKRVKRRYRDFRSTAKFLLIAEYGETILERNVSILTTPIFSIPIANFLNGVSESFSYGANHESSIEKFIAPKAKVLVVDDISTNLNVAEGLMLPYKMQVELCRSGITAIDMVKTDHYDAVFMDHMMPEMDGVETTARIRAMGDKDSYFKTLPIIALTANAVSGTREMFYENGFDDFLPKPIDTMQLNVILERWIPKEKQIRSTGKSHADTILDAYENIKIDGLNIKKGLTSARGSYSNYLNILAVFYKDGAEKIEEIKSCIENDDMSLYTIHVHALKSACAIIGAEVLSETAAELEEAGKKGDLTFIHINNAGFLTQLERLLFNINTVLSEEMEVNQKESVDKELFKTELSRLKTALINFDSAEINRIANTLQEFAQMPEAGDSVKAILQNRLIGEYDEAISIIDDLVRTLENQS